MCRPVRVPVTIFMQFRLLSCVIPVSLLQQSYVVTFLTHGFRPFQRFVGEHI